MNDFINLDLTTANIIMIYSKKSKSIFNQQCSKENLPLLNAYLTGGYPTKKKRKSFYEFVDGVVRQHKKTLLTLSDKIKEKIKTLNPEEVIILDIETIDFITWMGDALDHGPYSKPFGSNNEETAIIFNKELNKKLSTSQERINFYNLMIRSIERLKELFMTPIEDMFK